MRPNTFFFLRWISIILLAASVAMVFIQLVNYSRLRSVYPAGMTIGGVDVAGLQPNQAVERLLRVYSLPIEVTYNEATFLIDPALTGFTLDMESMLAAADLVRTGGDFWNGYWDYLWNRAPAPVDIPLRASLSTSQLRNYLANEVAPRYDIPAIPATPRPGTALFDPGTPGRALDIERAVLLVEDAFYSPSGRKVALSYVTIQPGRPALRNLQTQIQQIIDGAGYDGVVGLYMLDLQSGEEIHFAYERGRLLSTQPDVAFTASSTIKIPILVAAYTLYGPTLSEDFAPLVLDMIVRSENPPSDRIMSFLDEVRGPLLVTEVMQKLGLQNTFIAGYFYPRAPLLQLFSTPSNQRVDVQTSLDVYNQTTASEMGYLLADIYQCAQTGGGTLVAVYPDKITQASCRQMIDFLSSDKIGVLIEAGVPEGTQVAHKHGWTPNSAGVIRDIADVGIVYTPAGNYVLVIFTHHPVQAVWEPVSQMIARISQAFYGYFNPPQ
jgi:beta-lactamase class A